MAEYEERSLEDLTEEPTPHRLEELRAKGSVAFSRELTSTMVLFAVLVLMYFATSKFFSNYTDLLKSIFSKDILAKIDISNWESVSTVAGSSMRLLAATFVPIALISVVMAILTSVAQIGFVISPEVLEPDFGRVNPISGFMRMLSWKSLTGGAKAVLKFFVITGAVFLVVRSQLPVIPDTISFGVTQLFGFLGSFSTRVFAVVWVFLLALAALDYWMQWFQFRKQARMTKYEAKQELKEREGDPQIRARIRSIQREMARKRMMKAVPKADVIITNPTHIAVAIQYDSLNMAAPKLVAKGADFLAEKIREIAREHGIPLVENKPLARTLYKNVKVGQLIPRSLYQAVAEILAYVYRLKGRRMGKKPE